MITYLTFISSFDFYQAGKILDIVSHAAENCEKKRAVCMYGERCVPSTCLALLVIPLIISTLLLARCISCNPAKLCFS